MTKPHQPTPDDEILYSEFIDFLRGPEVAEYRAAVEVDTAITKRAVDLQFVFPELTRPDMEAQVRALRFAFREAARLRTEAVRNTLRLTKALNAVSEGLHKLLADEYRFDKGGQDGKQT